jgi:hypothetical protein
MRLIVCESIMKCLKENFLEYKRFWANIFHKVFLHSPSHLLHTACILFSTHPAETEMSAGKYQANEHRHLIDDQSYHNLSINKTCFQSTVLATIQ